MKLFIGLIVLFGVWCYCKYRTDWTFDNRMPRDGYETDHSAINRDLASGIWCPKEKVNFDIEENIEDI